MVTILKPQHACFVTNYVMYVGMCVWVYVHLVERERVRVRVQSLAYWSSFLVSNGVWRVQFYILLSVQM